MKYMLIVVLSNWTEYEGCNGQADHLNRDFQEAGETWVASCIVAAPYAPNETIRPIARPEAVAENG